MTFAMNTDQFEMRELHRHLLAKNRLYLLHNLRPTETFWSTLYSKDVLSQDMIDEIKAERTMSTQVGHLLDVLPARGPLAFESFCEALLESDHSHVAEYLKTIEATDHFRIEVEPLTSEIMLDRLVSIFKKNTPAVQRFAERKFELILEEQERDLQSKEEENKELENKCTMITLEVSQLQNFLSSCTEISGNLAHEIQRDFLSKMFLRDEKKHLEKLRLSLKDINGFEKMCSFYTNMQNVLTYMEKFAGVIHTKDDHLTRSVPSGYPTTSNVRSLHEKIALIMNTLVDMVDELGSRTNVPGYVLTEELNKVMANLKEIMSDVWRIRDVFHSTMKQKKRLEGEVLLLLHNLQEIRRLEREVKEKQAHITDLNKQGQVMKKKTKHHRKLLEQIHLNVEQRKIQLSDVQHSLERQLNSADQRLHIMLTLLPDLDEGGDIMRSDTDLTSDASMASRLNTPNLRPVSVFRPKSGLVGSLGSDMMKQRLQDKMESDNVGIKGDGKVDNNKSVTETKNGGLLEKRKAKQGLLAKEEVGSKASPRKVTKERQGLLMKNEKGGGVKRGPNDKHGESKAKCSGEVSKNAKDALDIDSWVAHEKTRAKQNELQNKLANFCPVATEDRTAEMEQIRKDDIDDKINLIKARNKQAQKPNNNEPPDKNEDKDEITVENGVCSEGKSESQTCSDSRSGSGSNKENSLSGSGTKHTPLLTMKSQGASFTGINDNTSNGNKYLSTNVSKEIAELEIKTSSILNLDSSDLPMHQSSSKYQDTDSWVPAKKRYGERESLKANKVEIRLPSN